MWISSDGFSLLELTMALVLGGIVMLAAITLFIHTQRVLQTQYALDDIQQQENWGVGVLIKDLRQINFNTLSRGHISPHVEGSGIIFSQTNLPQSIKQNIDAFVTKHAYSEGGTVEKSDQLLIQYQPAYVVTETEQIKPQHIKTSVVGIDCEGRQIERDEVENESTKMIVNRYFIAPDRQQMTEGRESYSLFCESGWYRSGDSTIHGLNGGGQQLIKGVEAFKIKLGVQNIKGQLTYMGIDQYQTAMAAQVFDLTQPYRVVSIEVGLLLRSNLPSMSSRQKSVPPHYPLLGQNLVLKKEQQQHLRRAVSQVVMLRNVQGQVGHD
ncbi:PilW family protein [Acinetobacter rudis]|uniref:PilW family protein n=1 Tax=Acinetobacter rudis TaxID=632955 RepID=A0AAW8J798_9GAMM|nr:PilW family protein [Acinetobacter rudis]MDQ8935308.1 PilW family protein [Acinetobacter rudis]MDQ9017497.1 PilW family protein [Acinetobacter rudis]